MSEERTDVGRRAVTATCYSIAMLYTVLDSVLAYLLTCDDLARPWAHACGAIARQRFTLVHRHIHACIETLTQNARC